MVSCTIQLANTQLFLTSFYAFTPFPEVFPDDRQMYSFTNFYLEITITKLCLLFLLDYVLPLSSAVWSTHPYSQIGPEERPNHARDSRQPSSMEQMMDSGFVLPIEPSEYSKQYRTLLPDNIRQQTRQRAQGLRAHTRQSTSMTDAELSRGDVRNSAGSLETSGTENSQLLPSNDRFDEPDRCIVPDLLDTLPQHIFHPKSSWRSKTTPHLRSFGLLPSLQYNPSWRDLQEILALGTIASSMFQQMMGPRLPTPLDEVQAQASTRHLHVANPLDQLERPCVDTQQLISCNSDRQLLLRTFDGTCNNLRNPLWGSAMQPYQRLGRHAYSDGITRPRSYSVKRRNGERELLLNPRLISLALSQSILRPHSTANLLMPAFAQVIASDLAYTPSLTNGRPPQDKEAQSIDCCMHNADCSIPECFQFSLHRKDPLYSMFNVTCHQFSRSTPFAPCSNGYFGQDPHQPREQFSQTTHWLDASFLYGTSEPINRGIRNLYHGQLSFMDIDTGLHNYQKAHITRQVLPPLPKDNPPYACPSNRCFLAADNRVNQHPLLAALHIIFLRFHNILATGLAASLQAKPGENTAEMDDELFNQARKLVVAVWQNMVYKEFLPVLLGSKVAGSALYGEGGLQLQPQESGYFRDYDDAVNPHVYNEFAASAFRLHTLLDGSVPRLLFVTGLSEDNPLSKGSADALINGMLEEMALAFDSQMAGDLQGGLFRGHRPFGLDLMAIDIQRGRDHGLASYNDIRQLCGYRRAQTFEQLADTVDFMPTNHVELLQQLYRSVDDVELMVGGLLENVVNEEASVGPTFACIIGLEFRNKKLGDRLWYENPQVFSLNQLDDIRKMTIADVLCLTTALRYVPKNAFLQVSDRNPLISCHGMPEKKLRRLLSLPK